MYKKGRPMKDFLYIIHIDLHKHIFTYIQMHIHMYTHTYIKQYKICRESQVEIQVYGKKERCKFQTLKEKLVHVFLNG